MKGARGTVLSYLRALDSGDYDAARGLLDDRATVVGPGEEYGPDRLIDVLRQHRSKYDLKKVFSDKDDVCVLYDIKTPSATVFMCSWYVVSGGKIVSVRTVFDPRPFAPAGRPPAQG
jgi:hypothetical protein